MKKHIAAILALSLAASIGNVFPVSAAGSELLHTDFESGLDGWGARGSASVECTSACAATGLQCASVKGRSESWNGIAYTLDSSKYPAGTKVSISAKVMQSTELDPVTFKFTVQYTTGSGDGGMFPGMGGNTTYDTFATVQGAAGLWSVMSKTDYVIGEGSNPVLYIETESSKCDFYVDDVIITTGALSDITDPPTPSNTKRGDADGNGKIEKADATALQKYLLGTSEEIDKKGADMDENGTINGKDLSMLKAYILNPPAETTTVTTTTTAPPTPPPSDHSAVMDTVKKNMTTNVPSNVQQNKSGEQKNITYFSQKANRNKNAIVWLPAGYTESKKYPVMYMNHGVMGSERDMLNGFAVLEMATNLIASGDAEPFIIVFPQMYTDPNSGSPMGINMDVMDSYDNYVYDLTDSLMPYIEEHFSIKTGKENTAIAGFSMGGRESLYVSMMHPEMFGYVCASSPAPGIVPASDRYITNHLGSKKLNSQDRMKNADFKYPASDLPYLLMIGGGTADGVVGQFPKEYHQILDTNGIDHIWLEIPNGGHDGSVGIPLFYNFFRGVFD